eukprot:TRINITY_DN1271_c0_g2_i1.p1 TRINITY_DN1271_c0_g2~~TRINITY_DN1271_c0_g2_i1.p1  ORF type:complete len:353 (+),score=46.30 TRINITY_DN1271_c0_g2_i1:2-1060(+)
MYMVQVNSTPPSYEVEEGIIAGTPSNYERMNNLATAASREVHSSHFSMEPLPPAKPPEEQAVLHSFKQNGRLICKFVKKPPAQQQRSPIFQPIRKDGRLLLRERNVALQRPAREGDICSSCQYGKPSLGSHSKSKSAPGGRTLAISRTLALPLFVPSAKILARSLSAAARMQSCAQPSEMLVFEKKTILTRPHHKLVRSSSASATPQQVDFLLRADVKEQSRFGWAPTHEMQCSLQTDMQHLVACSPRPTIRRTASMPDACMATVAIPSATKGKDNNCPGQHNDEQSSFRPTGSQFEEDKQEFGNASAKRVMTLVSPDAAPGGCRFRLRWKPTTGRPKIQRYMLKTRCPCPK